MILIIDNYDSFTFNLVQICERLGNECAVYRNDQVSVTRIIAEEPEAILLSPGPGTPRQAGICMELLHHIKTIPILGVCLGHQAIAQAYGADLIRANEPVHGKTSQIYHASNDVFAGIPSPIRVARYHSLIVPAESLPYDLEVTAHADDGTVMGLQHRKAPIFGLQFHPESIATEYGETMLSNFVRLAREFGQKKRTAAPGN